MAATCSEGAIGSHGGCKGCKMSLVDVYCSTDYYHLGGGVGGTG
ncbi:Uncharacterised protein [uncultured archaeon]|nr:Uncharacterised protein [uncultured archaeon]